MQDFVLLVCICFSHLAASGGHLGKVSSADGVVRSGEFCDTEVFRGECPEGRVILVTLARYGRMKVGRCVEFHLGYINCFTDVILEMDSRCSGRQRCEVRVPDAEFETTRPCLKELKNYLELSYACLKVNKLVTHSCSKHEVNATSQNGYVLPVAPSRDLFKCSTHFQPTTFWVLAQPGQHVLLSLYDLSINDRKRRLGSARWNKNSCDEVFGWYKEEEEEEEEERRKEEADATDGGGAGAICSAGLRVSTVVRTKHHRLKMWFEPRETQQTRWGTEDNQTSPPVSFIVRFSIHGCPNIDANDSLNRLSSSSFSSSLSSSSSSSSVYFYEPTDAGEKLKVGCEKGDWRWVLRCSASSNTWIGHLGNCSKQPKGADNQRKNPSEDAAMSYGVAIVAGGILGVIIALFIIVIISCNRNRRQPSTRGADIKPPFRQMADYSKVSKCSCLVAGRTLCQCVPQTSMDSKTYLTNKACLANNTCLTSVSFTVVNESKEPLLLDRNFRHGDLLAANHELIHYGSKEQQMNRSPPDKCQCASSSSSRPTSPLQSGRGESLNVCRKMSLIRQFEPVVECSENF